MDQKKIQNAVNMKNSGTMKISMKLSFPCTTRASACFVVSTSNSSGGEESYACYYNESKIIKAPHTQTMYAKIDLKIKRV